MTTEKKACWRVSLPSGKSFPMVGEPCTREEALEYSRGIWPGAEVE